MNSTTYKVAVLNDHLAQYFNHSAVHVPKNIKVFGNYYYYSIRFSTFASKIIFNYANVLSKTKMRIRQKTNLTAKYYPDSPE